MVMTNDFPGIVSRELGVADFTATASWCNRFMTLFYLILGPKLGCGLYGEYTLKSKCFLFLGGAVYGGCGHTFVAWHVKVQNATSYKHIKIRVGSVDSNAMLNRA
jgi:hypothetical protein